MLKMPSNTWKNTKKSYTGFEMGLSDIQVIVKNDDMEMVDEQEWETENDDCQQDGDADPMATHFPAGLSLPIR